MHRVIYYAFLVALALSSCQGQSETLDILTDPEDVQAAIVAGHTVRLSWSPVSGAASYKVFLRGSADPYYVNAYATLEASAKEYVFTEVPSGDYYFGVQALSKDKAGISRLVYSPLLTIPADTPSGPDNPEGPDVPDGPDTPDQPDVPPADKPTFTVSATYATSAYLGIRYSIGNIGGTSPAHGICFSEHAEPTISDKMIAGPAPGTASMLQLIPATLLAYGKTFHVRPYATVASGTYYGEDSALALEPEPEAITLDWQRITPPGLAAGIEVYETTSKLGTRNFHAWYAIADCTGDIAFRVQYPSSTRTLENQFPDQCQVLVNGSVFGGSGKSIGMAISDGARSAWREEADGQYWGKNELLQITRATFGVDAAGHPFTCWSGLPDASHIWYYDQPLTSVAGEARFGACTATHPSAALSLTPYNALAGGPMLLHGGVCPSDLSKTADNAYYMTNYERWDDSGIYGGHPDRTAVGYTADGKVVLFVCDGRITSSAGATVTELARILKGIGCVGAINLDGGDSTRMLVRGKGVVTDQTRSNRAVCTTIGFFKK